MMETGLDGIWNRSIVFVADVVPYFVSQQFHIEGHGLYVVFRHIQLVETLSLTIYMLLMMCLSIDLFIYFISSNQNRNIL